MSDNFRALPESAAPTDFKYLLEVYMDDYIVAAIATEKRQLNHLSNAVKFEIHYVFPPDENDKEDPISFKKLEKKEGSWALVKDILGLTFDGNNKTVWLEESKRNAILTILHGWICSSRNANHGIPFNKFHSILKIRHAFTTIPVGKGLLSPFYKILAKQPKFVFLHHNKRVLNALKECQIFLHESISTPTKCNTLITAWPDYVSIKDASKQGVGGIIIGEENKTVPPTVFHMQWSDDIKQNVVSQANPTGTITNSDFEMAGLMLLWLVMEAICPSLTSSSHIALFSDNSPTVHWVERLASRHSDVAMQLI
jgi:hypothetical protein